MNMKNIVIVSSVFLLTTAILGFATGSNEEKSATEIKTRPVWEYKIWQLSGVRSDTNEEKQLNELGELGWELVSVIEETGPRRSSSPKFYLKRIK